MVIEKDKRSIEKLKHKAIVLDDDFESMANTRPKKYTHFDNKKANLYDNDYDNKDLNNDNYYNGVEENLNRNKKIMNEDKLSIHEIYNRNMERLKVLNGLTDTETSSFNYKTSDYKPDYDYEDRNNNRDRNNFDNKIKKMNEYNNYNSNYRDNYQNYEVNSSNNTNSKNPDDFDSFIKKLENLKSSSNKRNTYDNDEY